MEEEASVVELLDRVTTPPLHLRHQSLQELIKLSRLPHNRSLLASHDALPLLLPLLLSTSDLPTLFFLLKLLRNLCANQPSNHLSFLHCHGSQSIAHIFSLLLSPFHGGQQIPSTFFDVFHMALQLLGNVSGAGDSQQNAIWITFFPTTFRVLASTNEDKIMEPLLMVLYTCSRGNMQRLTDFCLGEGAALLAACFRAATPTGVLSSSARDWLYLLVSQLCFQTPLFRLLFTNLGELAVFGTPATPNIPNVADIMFSPEQAALLDTLCFLLSEKAQAQIEGSCFEQQKACEMPMPSESIGFLAHIIRVASKVSDTGCPYRNRPCGIPAIDVLGYALELIKILSGWECDRHQKIISLGSKYREHERCSVVAELVSHGFIRLCIELLQDIGPPELILQAMKDSKVDLDTGLGSQLNGVHTHARLNAGEQGDPSSIELNRVEECAKIRTSKCPYQGYRRDLVAIIGNMSHQNWAVQDEVRKLGGLILILQQCVVDENNPFLREWGLWAVRNLVDGNEDNRKEVSEIQLKGSITPVELAQMRLKVEMDPLIGRPRLVNAP